jgi:formate dehydrogenase maturation protein FdhE
MELLSSAATSELVKEIKADAAAAPPDLKDIFCKGWPEAKKVLEALIKIIKNPIAQLVLEAVETIGNAAQTAICKK